MEDDVEEGFHGSPRITLDDLGGVETSVGIRGESPISDISARGADSRSRYSMNTAKVSTSENDREEKMNSSQLSSILESYNGRKSTLSRALEQSERSERVDDITSAKCVLKQLHIIVVD